MENYSNKLFYDQIDTTHANMCFRKITITHSVNWMDHVTCSKHLFGSVPDYRKLVILLFLVENVVDLKTNVVI